MSRTLSSAAFGGRPKSKILLLQASWSDQLFTGIATYASKYDWDLDASHYWNAELPMVRCDGAEGVIAQVGTGSRRSEILRFLSETKLPVVYVDDEEAVAVGQKILVNLREIAAVSVDHFRRRSFQEITFISFSETRASISLRRSLEEEMAGVMQLHSIHPGKLTDWVRNCSKPSAVIAANDLDAVRIVQMCSNLRVRVPEEIAVLGIGNNGLLCSSGHISVSSVETNMAAVGYEAAAALSLLMSNQPLKNSPTLISPVGVARRRSTDTIAMKDSDAAIALRFVRENYRSPLNRNEIYDMLGPQALRTERVFKKYLGRTISQELTRLRMEEAVKLLADETVGMDEVAMRCGFEGRFSLDRVFYRHYGCTPRTYRLKLMGEAFLGTERFESSQLSAPERRFHVSSKDSVLEAADFKAV
ncbi:MAG: substrate-binding domain-containing protein [Nibricoccus sp.]